MFVFTCTPSFEFCGGSVQYQTASCEQALASICRHLERIELGDEEKEQSIGGGHTHCEARKEEETCARTENRYWRKSPRNFRKSQVVIFHISKMTRPSIFDLVRARSAT